MNEKFKLVKKKLLTEYKEGEVDWELAKDVYAVTIMCLVDDMKANSKNPLKFQSELLKYLKGLE